MDPLRARHERPAARPERNAARRAAHPPRRAHAPLARHHCRRGPRRDCRAPAARRARPLAQRRAQLSGDLVVHLPPGQPRQVYAHRLAHVRPCPDRPCNAAPAPSHGRAHEARPGRVREAPDRDGGAVSATAEPHDQPARGVRGDCGPAKYAKHHDHSCASTIFEQRGRGRLHGPGGPHADKQHARARGACRVVRRPRPQHHHLPRHGLGASERCRPDGHRPVRAAARRGAHGHQRHPQPPHQRQPQPVARRANARPKGQSAHPARGARRQPRRDSRAARDASPVAQ